MEVEKGSLKFQWDKGNLEKNLLKHGLTIYQIEEVFFNSPLYFFVDYEHSGIEKRYSALGHDKEFNLIFVSFVIREERIRVISARAMDKKERKRYGKNI